MNKKTFCAGDRIGKLTLEEDSGQRKSRHIVWKCRCDCGRTVLLDSRTLKRGTWQSCGCDRAVKPGMEDLTGKRFGRLVCLETVEKDGKHRSTLWRCRCDCGQEVVTTLSQLKSGKKKSCGCFASEASRERLRLTDGTSLLLIERYSRKEPCKSNTSGRTGVCRHKRTGKWEAKIQFRKKCYHLGLFTDFKDAVKARERAEEELFGSCADVRSSRVYIQKV